MPKIAQHDVDGSELRLDKQIVSNPTDTTVNLHVENTATSHSLFTPVLDGFNASLFLESTEPDIKPFGILRIPAMHATRTFQTVVDQELEILDREQFIAYNKIVTQSDKFRFAMRGRTKLHLGALPVVSVDFNKAIETKGLNGFKGIGISNVNISLAGFPDGSNMHGTINIPNQSVMTLTIGDMLQDIYVDGTLIGNTTINNVVLQPGDNLFQMSSITDQAIVMKFLTGQYNNGILPVEARTRSITYKGVNLWYFEEAMKASPVHLDLDLSSALAGMGLGSILNKGKAGGSGTGKAAILKT